MRVAKSRYGSSPVFPISKACDLLDGDPLAPLDKARASTALDHLTLDLP
jgi:hypothetical protein